MSYLREKARWIARAWEGSWSFLPALVFMTFLSASVTLIYPLVFGKILDRLRVIGEEGTVAQSEVNTLVWILLAIGLARFLAGFYPAVRAHVNYRIERGVRARYFHRVMQKGQAFFTRFRTGDVITRLTDDVAGYPKIAWFSCSGLFRALNSGTQIVLCMIVMFALDRNLALWSLLPIAPMLVVYLLLKKQLREASQAQRAAASETSASLEAYFSGVTVIQAHVAESRIGDAMGEQLTDRAVHELRLAKLWVAFSIFFQATNVVGQLVIVCVGGLRVLDGSLSLGTFFVFYHYLGLLLGPMMDLPNLLVTSRQAFVCMERLDEIDDYDREGEGGACRGERPVETVEHLRAVDLAFGYPGPPPDVAEQLATSKIPAPFSLGPLELDLREGERLAVIGEVGSGKTTLLRLLAGTCEPDAGAVSLDGVPLRELLGESYRRAVGYVPQTPVLFTATIRENVLMGREEDSARLEESLRLAGLWEEVQGFPTGLDHPLGILGTGLSGGQRQRLTIARALYGRPKLLLLDDLTAALDAENEERFWEGVLDAHPELTALVVTHREATAKRCDRILEMVGGRLVPVTSQPTDP
ncbi:MAG: ABC transporter ATP-binding protein [Planctomycetes bacterium]|nr:ABC transporter ATP-binding protein [Planctomycetota bacterium]